MATTRPVDQQRGGNAVTSRRRFSLSIGHVVGYAAAFAVLAGPFAQAIAGGRAVYSVGAQGQQHRMTVEWRDAHTARIEMPGMQGQAYFLLKNGKGYTVSNGHVFAMSSFTRMMAAHRSAASMARPELRGPQGTETVAGIRGQVYTVHWNGQAPNGVQDEQVVLTSNSTVREVTRVWQDYAKSLAGARGGMASNPSIRALGDKGLLRAGNNMRLVSISSTTPPASAFTLPSRPVSMFSGGSPQSGGSGPYGSASLSSMIGQAMRNEAKAQAQNQVNQAVDQAKHRAFSDAMRNLIGNALKHAQ